MSNACVLIVSDLGRVRHDKTNLARCGFAYGRDQRTELVTHGLGCDAGGCGLEVDVAGTADSSIVGVAAGHERGRHAGESQLVRVGAEVCALYVDWRSSSCGNELRS